MASVKFQKVGFEDLFKTINNLGLNIHDAAEEALTKSHELVTKQVKQEMARYKENTGAMKDSFLDNSIVTWFGENAQIKAGFNQKQSQHATYMMITGTPYREPDRKLYNAIYGAATKKAIKEIQEQALMKVIEGGY